MSRIYIEENGKYKIDLRTAIWSQGDLNEVYKSIGNALNDVDFIAETDNEFILIEYKSTEIENAENPEAFNEKFKNGKFQESIIKKYYGSVFYLLACGKKKPISFYAVIESRLMDDNITRKRAEASIKKSLPFDLQEKAEISITLISEFKILSISEWNERYPMFPLERCQQEVNNEPN